MAVINKQRSTALRKLSDICTYTSPFDNILIYRKKALGNKFKVVYKCKHLEVGDIF